jgi:hypothetical protein
VLLSLQSTVFSGCSAELSVAFIGGMYIWWSARDEEKARGRMMPTGKQRRREEQAAARGGYPSTDSPTSAALLPTGARGGFEGWLNWDSAVSAEGCPPAPSDDIPREKALSFDIDSSARHEGAHQRKAAVHPEVPPPPGEWASPLDTPPMKKKSTKPRLHHKTSDVPKPAI